MRIRYVPEDRELNPPHLSPPGQWMRDDQGREPKARDRHNFLNWHACPFHRRPHSKRQLRRRAASKQRFLPPDRVLSHHDQRFAHYGVAPTITQKGASPAPFYFFAHGDEKGALERAPHDPPPRRIAAPRFGGSGSSLVFMNPYVSWSRTQKRARQPRSCRA